MKVGIYGGTFDPVHRGHVDPVVEAAALLDLDRVLYLPTAHPPHKLDRTMAPIEDRHAMLELALNRHPGLEVSTLEMESAEPVYSHQTVDRLRRRHPDWELFFILGADAYRDLHTYRSWEEIVASTKIVVLLRPGTERPDPERETRAPLAAALARGDVYAIENRAVDVSGSELRRCLANGAEPSAHEVDPAVLEFIRKSRLYR